MRTSTLVPALLPWLLWAGFPLLLAPPNPPIPYPPFPSQQDDIHPSPGILSAGMSLRLSAALFAQCKELRLAARCNRFHLEPVILLFGLVPLGFPECRVRETRWDSSRLYQIIQRRLALITPTTGYCQGSSIATFQGKSSIDFTPFAPKARDSLSPTSVPPGVNLELTPLTSVELLQIYD